MEGVETSRGVPGLAFPRVQLDLSLLIQVNRLTQVKFLLCYLRSSAR